MSKSTSKTTVFSILIGLAGIAATIYFWVQNDRLQSELASIKEQQNDPAVQTLRQVDTLLIKGDYKRAAKLSDSLKQTRHLLDSTEVALKAQLAEALRDAKQETPHYEYLTFKTSKDTELHYVGEAKNHKANGYGIAILESGSRYEGQWRNNMMHGEGKFYWDDGEYYEGNYVNDKRQGYGVYHWEDGRKYVGGWKEDSRNGKGKYYNKKGKLETEGVWEDDELVEEK